jgi:uncharacterized small protein (DUF1192 family)
MKHLNIEIAVLRSPDFLGADPVDRATWLCLLAFCADQENSGIIRGCRGWKDRQWQQVAGVTLEEVNKQCLLWNWCGDDLLVLHYPTKAEDFAKGQRENGRKGGKSRAANASSTPSSTPSRVAQPNVRKGNVRKSNVIQSPTLEEVQTAASMMGVEARLAEIFWNECEARPISPDGEWTAKDGTPMRNWRNALKAFGERWKANENRNGTAFARNGASTLSTKPLSVWEAKEKKNALQAELERMKADRRWRQAKTDTPWETEWNAEGKAKVREIREKIAKMEEVIAA